MEIMNVDNIIYNTCRAFNYSGAQSPTNWIMNRGNELNPKNCIENPGKPPSKEFAYKRIGLQWKIDEAAMQLECLQRNFR